MSPYFYSLPIEEHKNKILDEIRRSKVCIIKGPTGCGKSTYIPYLLSLSFPSCRIAIIEPRRIAVTSLHSTLSSTMEGVGYKMRFSKSIKKDTKTIIYTDGSFLNEVIEREFDYIIVDEVHERSIRTDVILGLFKNSIRNMKGKVILMSATVDTQKLASYFKASVLDIPGVPHPVKIEYLPECTSDYIVESYSTIKRILLSKENVCEGLEVRNKDILVFLPGEEDINELYTLLKKLPVIRVYKIFSALSDKEQNKIYEPSSLRKVILSTNICETSLTIPGIGYVIDTGLHKVKIYDQMSCLGIQAISKESADQRLGRCNRTGPGICYRLYTEHVYNTLPPHQSPEICRSDLCQVFLQLLVHRKNLLRFEFLDYPTRANAVATLSFLLEKGCISINNVKEDNNPDLSATLVQQDVSLDSIELNPDDIRFRITKYGRLVLRHPFDVHLSHFYQQCLDKNAGYLGSILVSLIGQDGCNFLKHKNKSQKTDIEFLVYLLEGYLESEDTKEYCIKHEVGMKYMETAKKIFLGLNRKKSGDIEMVERIFSFAYKHNLCERMKDGSYRHLGSNEVVWIHPSSCFFKRKDRFVVFVDAFYTTKAYARIVGKYFKSS
ncbi:HrpA-like helicase [Encephalitozoon hellem ATCC 50504]|uniref:Helicase n=1 Tax=Encephalitozoon hellem TaxID=27973 RepID=A0A9Q9C2K4_ENCHE|nr:HrpA-like helicase [Encephalitozoon hellem ATCC 50504]AFM98070.1 HrpA-like helicase [Encephalitozoon hellem ATCC 50504]UTX42911.1 RNA helicase [Encephalitozoon hellem]WEL38368.1 helicase [Encephalitozoon hellem]|eukprot:XP_003887051.1 HrpA-like helicase [Encephalitozoon hellem ATCC 50504]